MEVYWVEQTEADLPAGDEWLSQSEAARLGTLRFTKRRKDWRLGRWTAKMALARYFKLPADPQILANFEIRAASSGAPEVFFQNKPAEAAVSLSHRAGLAVCAVAPSNGVLGCDLEIIEPRSDAFLTDYFTTEEKSLVAGTCVEDRSRLLALLWSAKESALKALHTGLRLDTRSVMVGLSDALRDEKEDASQHEVDPTSLIRSSGGLNVWHPLQVRCQEGQIFNGWWQHTQNLIRTLAAFPAPEPPILLEAVA